MLLAKLRVIIAIISDLATITAPIYTAEGLRKILDVVARLGEIIEIPDEVMTRITEALADQTVFNLLLAVVQFAYSRVTTLNTFTTMGAEDTVTVLMEDGELATITVAAIRDWLPIVVQLITLIQELKQLWPQALLLSTEE